MEENIIKKRLWLVAAIIVAAIMMSIPTPDGLTPEGYKTIALLVMVVILFITEAIPVAAVALVIGMFEVYVIGFSSRDVAASYASDTVFFIMGALMIAVALIKQGIAQRVALFIISHAGTSVNRVVFGLVFTCAITAAFVADHTVAALMLPVALIIIKLSGGIAENRNLAKLLLFSVAYGCAIGRLSTPSGGARNAIIMEYMGGMFDVSVGYGQWMLYAFPITVILIPLVSLVLPKIFKPEVNDISHAVENIREELKESGPITWEMYGTITIFIFTLMLWIFGKSYDIGLGTAAVTGAVFFLVFGIVRWRDYNTGVVWGVILLYAGAISLGNTMLDTGAALWLAQKFLGALTVLAGSEPSSFTMAIAVSIFTMLMTNMMSDGATVSVIGPIMLEMAHAGGVSILLIGLTTSVSSAFAYMLVIGTPPNAIIHSSGYVKGRDFLISGAVLSVITIIVMVFVMGVYWIGFLGL